MACHLADQSLLQGEYTMKIGLVMCGPDVDYGPLALLSGTFEEKASKVSLTSSSV